METIYLISLESAFQASLLQSVLNDLGIDSFLKNEMVS